MSFKKYIIWIIFFSQTYMVDILFNYAIEHIQLLWQNIINFSKLIKLFVHFYFFTQQSILEIYRTLTCVTNFNFCYCLIQML